jgi:hypothetical protein
VDINTAAYSNEKGAAEFNFLWEDADFDSRAPAFYYLRVLQILTPRHSLYDAVALNIDPPEGFPVSIQERAYTSPVFYSP